MTLCIAAMADDRKTIVMAADRMVSVEFIESELEISKIIQIHKHWWVMLAANTLAGAFPIIDSAKEGCASGGGEYAEDVLKIVADAYQNERLKRAEATYLAPRGLDIQTFLMSGKDMFPEITFREIDLAISQYDLTVSLLVCGFDKDNLAHIFTVTNPGIGYRLDIPGFHAIGSGFYGATYMMYYRELSHVTPCHEWLYYIYEAKAFGEQAGAVGLETELLVARPGQPVQRIDKDGYRESLDRLWNKHKPGHLDGNDKRSLRNLLASQSTKT